VFFPYNHPKTDYCINTLTLIASSPTSEIVNITVYVAKVSGSTPNNPISSAPNSFYGQTATFTLALTPAATYYDLPLLFNLTTPDSTRAGIFITTNASFLWSTTALCDGGAVDGYPTPGISTADTFQARFQNGTDNSWYVLATEPGSGSFGCWPAVRVTGQADCNIAPTPSPSVVSCIAMLVRCASLYSRGIVEYDKLASSLRALLLFSARSRSQPVRSCPSSLCRPARRA
jgi:hypothetical protein